MKSVKFFALFAALAISTAASAQLSLVKFGVKGGLNFPQESLDLDAIANAVADTSFNIQTDDSDGFNAGIVARVSLPLLPAYIHAEVLYTQFEESITVNGTENTSTIQRLDFPISVGAKIGPIFGGAGLTPSIPLSSASMLLEPDEEVVFTSGFHIHAGVKLGQIMAELKYESGLSEQLSGAINTLDPDLPDVEIDQRRSQVVASVAYFF